MSKKKETKEERSERRRKELRLALRVFRYFLPYKWAMVVALLASAVVSGTTAGTAWLIKPALDDIFIRQDGTALLYVPLAFIVLTALKGAGRYLQNWCMHYSALHVLETMRQELFQKIITLPLHFYEESQVGALMSRVINDVGMIRQSLPAFIQIIRQVITMISLLYVVFQQNFELACWAIIVLPVAGFPLSLFSRALRRYGRKNAEVNASISSMLQELLSGIRVIKAFATEKQETGRFNKENARIININFRQSCVSELSSPVMELIGAIGIGLVIWYGGREVIQGDMTPGTFFAFMGALAMLYTPFKSLNGANMNVQNALAGAERVFAILDDPALKTERGGTLPLDEPFRELTFRDVSLYYGDESTPALRGVSLTVKAGERIAFVGPSGAGKTTLVNLIPRFYDPQRGEILLNGKPLKEYSLASLRRSVSMVSQDAFLFDMTIAENIAYGRDLSSELDMDRVRSAAVAAYADGFIRELPEGYETPIGERGVRLSGGQKQRLTIARALLKDAPLPPAPWIPNPNTWFRRPSTTSCSTAPALSSRTGFPPFWKRIASWSWNAGASSTSDGTRNCLGVANCIPACTTCSSARTKISVAVKPILWSPDASFWKIVARSPFRARVLAVPPVVPLAALYRNQPRRHRKHDRSGPSRGPVAVA